MKKAMKILAVAAVLLVAGGVTLVALVMQYDYNQLKPTIERMAKEATGRDLTIAGDLDLAVSLQPTLSVEGITFANAPWSKNAQMVKLARLDAKLDLMSLVQGRVDVDYIVIDGLNVVLETDAQGRANWEFDVPAQAPGEAQAGGLVLAPNVGDVRVLDAKLAYIDGRTGKRIDVELARAALKADGFSAPINATLAGEYQGVALNASVDMGSFEQLVGSSGEPFPVDMQITAPGVLATLKGSVEQPRQGLGVNAHVDVRVTDGATLSLLAGTDLPDLSGMTARFAVAGEGRAYEISAIDVRVGDSDVAGSLSVDVGGARPSVKGKITSKVLNLDQLLDLDAPTPTASAPIPRSAPEGEAAQVFSRDPLPFDALKAADANVELFAGRVLAKGLTVDAFKANVNLNAGRLNVPAFALALEGGDIAGAASLDGNGTKAPVRLKTTVQNLDAGRILEALGLGTMLTLPISGDVDVSSVGNSVHLIMRNLEGRARFAARGGRFDDTALKAFTTGVGSLLPWAKQADGSVITCMVADVPMAGGVAEAKTILMNTPGFNVGVTGNVDLGGERLHLTVIPNAKQASLASFAVPIRLKGALSAPYVDVDPGDAVVGTVGNIVKAPASIIGGILGGVLPKSDQAKQAAVDPCLDGLNGAKGGTNTKSGNASQPSPSDGQMAPPPGTASGTPSNDGGQPKLPGADAIGKALGGLLGQ